MNPQHGRYLRQFAAQYGVPWSIAQALIRQESGGNPNARSPAGAIGYGQLMPGTARGLGVNPHNPIENLRGSMMYLGHLIHSFGGNIRYALAAYNAGPGAVKRFGGIPPYAETQNYVKSILAMAGPGQNNRQFTTRRLAAVNAGLGSQAGAPDLQRALALAQPTEADQSILGRLGGTAARAALAASAPIPLPASATGGGRGSPLPMPGSMTLPAPSQFGNVVVAPGANRPGVGLHGDILSFAHHVAGVFGQKLRITTGTQHNQFVLGTRRQSAHWTGEAADIAAKGARLTRLGQAALIAAGADPRWARKQRGGLFNIGGFQVIFNSMEGGNHYNHLHIGIRGHG